MRHFLILILMAFAFLITSAHAEEGTVLIAGPGDEVAPATEAAPLTEEEQLILIEQGAVTYKAAVELKAAADRGLKATE